MLKTPKNVWSNRFLFIALITAPIKLFISRYYIFFKLKAPPPHKQKFSLEKVHLWGKSLMKKFEQP